MLLPELHTDVKGQVRWSGIPILKNFPQFIVIHTVKGFAIVNKAEVDVFLELFCFFCDQTDVGNLILFHEDIQFLQHHRYKRISLFYSIVFDSLSEIS